MSNIGTLWISGECKIQQQQQQAKEICLTNECPILLLCYLAYFQLHIHFSINSYVPQIALFLVQAKISLIFCRDCCSHSNGKLGYCALFSFIHLVIYLLIQCSMALETNTESTPKNQACQVDKAYKSWWTWFRKQKKKKYTNWLYHATTASLL